MRFSKRSKWSVGTIVAAFLFLAAAQGTGEITQSDIDIAANINNSADQGRILEFIMNDPRTNHLFRKEHRYPDLLSPGILYSDWIFTYLDFNDDDSLRVIKYDLKNNRLLQVIDLPEEFYFSETEFYEDNFGNVYVLDSRDVSLPGQLNIYNSNGDITFSGNMSELFPEHKDFRGLSVHEDGKTIVFGSINRLAVVNNSGISLEAGVKLPDGERLWLEDGSIVVLHTNHNNFTASLTKYSPTVDGWNEEVLMTDKPFIEFGTSKYDQENQFIWARTGDSMNPKAYIYDTKTQQGKEMDLVFDGKMERINSVLIDGSIIIRAYDSNIKNFSYLATSFHELMNAEDSIEITRRYDITPEQVEALRVPEGFQQYFLDEEMDYRGDNQIY